MKLRHYKITSYRIRKSYKLLAKLINWHTTLNTDTGKSLTNRSQFCNNQLAGKYL